MRIVVTTDETVARADEVVDFLRGPRLWIPRTDYPDFDDWLQKSWIQLRSEIKRAILAIQGGEVVGVVIYQPHLQNLGCLEIKNISVRPDARGRHIASFLLRNAEIEGAADFGCRRVVVDTKARNREMRCYLKANGYGVLKTSDLYGLDSGIDVTYGKSIRRQALNIRRVGDL